MNEGAPLVTKQRRSILIRLVLSIAAAAVVLGLVATRRSGDVSLAKGLATAPVRRDNLIVTVTEGGSLAAVRSMAIKCEVEGQSRILKIVPEGSIVKKGDVLVELDSADLADRITGQEITLENAKSNYAQGSSAYEIQRNQNESNIQGAKLKVKFARLDLEKYVGEVLTDSISPEMALTEVALSEDLAAQGLQKRMSLQSDIDLAREEQTRAADKVNWTRTLAEKGYVTGTELKADELALIRAEVKLKLSKIALDVFCRYEFPRQVEQLHSDLREAQRELERVNAKATSEIAKAEANMNASKQTLELQTSKLNKLREQFEKTTILAPQDGMVVYASSMSQSRRPSSTLIEEGATVRYQQHLISLPDTSTMKVEVNIHEAAIEKVKVDMSARIRVDAFPDRLATGRVTKVALLPDSPMRWLNPDIKKYKTEVTLDDNWDGLKPGLSAQVTILVAQLDSVLVVPLQAVVEDEDGANICYVLDGGRTLKTPVKVGLSNDSFAQIADGLALGNRVVLAPPQVKRRTTEPTEGESDETSPKASGDEKQPSPEATGEASAKSSSSAPEAPSERRGGPRGEGGGSPGSGGDRNGRPPREGRRERRAEGDAKQRSPQGGQAQTGE